MAKNERFLTVDIGATSIKLCEFEFAANGQMVMSVFAYREYEKELSAETRLGVIEGVLRQMLMESNVRARRAMLSLSGQSSLIRFGKINIIKDDRKQIRQLAEFEAKRNIPFKLDEISLDYQLIAGTQNENDERILDVMSVIIKRDEIEQYTQAVRNVGLSPVLIDVAPVACYNAARANNVGQESCELIVSIGGRSTNLMFIEGERFFARTIPIAGYAISQQIAKEIGVGIPEAEELKRHHGFVALGGAYADPGSETAATVSKIIRNVMSRLHGEISRSINIYRAQQRGNAPSKIYLTGGSSILTYCDVFFAEKFNVPVEYFNPFQVVDLAPSVDRARLSEVAHMFSEVLGLAFRYSRPCPIEINLLPRRIMRQQALLSKKPYFVTIMACILAGLGLLYKGSTTAVRESQYREKDYSAERAKYETDYNNISSAIGAAEAAESNISELKKFLGERTVWPMVMEEIFRAKPDNVWIDSITPIMNEVMEVQSASVVEEDAGGLGGDDMMGMGGSMSFGGDGMSSSMDSGMGMGGGLGGGPSVEKGTVAGFTIVAHTISIPGVKRFGVEPTLAPEPEYIFSVPEKSSEETEEESSNDEELLDGDEEQQPVAAKPREIDLSGENLFVHNLRKSKLFSNEELMTTIVERSNNEYLKNGHDFTIQVKFNAEIEAYPWPFEGSEGKGGMDAAGSRSSARSARGEL